MWCIMGFLQVSTTRIMAWFAFEELQVNRSAQQLIPKLDSRDAFSPKTQSRSNVFSLRG